jgi:polysaccharide export outer membrane protein
MAIAKVVIPALILCTGTVNAQSIASSGQIRPGQSAVARSTTTPAAAAVIPPPEYVIGPDDVLSVMFWRDKDISLEVTVRPDGRISVPLINDVQAAGLTPLQLRDRLTEDAQTFVDDPNVTVIVRQINSRRVFVAGEVNKPGPYPLMDRTTVLQMLAMAGGLKDYASGKDIAVMRPENGRTVVLPFNYKDVAKHKNLQQNIELKPGDTIVVP